ncbi:hypothetical protein [Ectobacillus polymachus]|uniref:hypothetical protein n=1 Tax=Ectobacillus polymachus TaxID=1508806 RepID=UPI003A86D202
MTEMFRSFRKDRLLLAKNYCLYDGTGNIEELARYDVMIVEPKMLRIGEVKQVKARNTVVLTYLSVAMVHPTEAIFQELSAEDFLFVEGKPVINERFGTYLVNLQSKKWVDYVLKEVHRHLLVLDSDGLFFDTLGDLELTTIPLSLRDKQLEAAGNLLSVLKLLYPQYVIIQNNGLKRVCLHTAPYIDGICWENPSLSVPDDKESVEAITHRLRALGKQYELKIFLLLEENTEKSPNPYTAAKKFAREQNFLLYYAPSNTITRVHSYR